MNTLKRFFTLILLISTLIPTVYADDNEAKKEEKKYGIKFSGFVKADFWYDSRMVRGVREDVILFYPLNSNWVNNIDANSTSSLHASPATSRLTGTVTAPDAFRAKTSGVLEADFSGSTNPGLNEFRLRHAYINLQWDKTLLTMGQFWHPMFVPEVFPDIISLNTGAPFQPFIRNPLIQLWQNITPELKVLGAAIFQRDNASINPLTGSPDPTPLRLAKLPNLHIQLQYNNGNVVAGIAADYKKIRPRLLTPDGMNLNEEYLGTTAFMGYLKYTSGKLTVRTKAIHGQNLTEHLLLSGYAVSAIDPVTGVEKYTPYNHSFFWINPTYGKKYTFGVFAGYAINHGTTENTNGTVYALFNDMKDIEQMYRLAPSFTLTEGKFKACVEFEHTGVFFGTLDPNDRNLVKDTKRVENNRMLLTLYYFF